MNVIWAIREICSGENGFETLFDEQRSYKDLPSFPKMPRMRRGFPLSFTEKREEQCSE